MGSSGLAGVASFRGDVRPKGTLPTCNAALRSKRRWLLAAIKPCPVAVGSPFVSRQKLADIGS
jgi:hypothetical protein